MEMTLLLKPSGPPQRLTHARKHALVLVETLDNQTGTSLTETLTSKQQMKMQCRKIRRCKKPDARETHVKSFGKPSFKAILRPSTSARPSLLMRMRLGDPFFTSIYPALL
jgi:hypothetical protein